MLEESPRAFVLRRKREMDVERGSFYDHWRELAEYILPRAPRFTVQDRTARGQKANKKIVDGTATLSLRALVSGLMSGVTSPARPWFKLSASYGKTPHELAVWLHGVTRTMQEVLVQSNFYTETAKLYQSCGLFGTGAMAILPDEESVLRCETFSIGTYWLATNDRHVVDEFLRDFTMTVRQMVEEFGFDKVSKSVQEMAKEKRWDNRIEIYHYIGPNHQWDPANKVNKFKRYKEWYVEVGMADSRQSNIIYQAEGDMQMPLRERGFDTFPIVAPRWEADGEDIYGCQSPAMQALPDIKRLQAEQKVKAKAIEKQADPPIIASASLKNGGLNADPGKTTYGDARAGQELVRPMYQVSFDVQGVMLDIQEIQKRIQRFFFEDLFLMVANERRSGTKAREIDELYEEKMTMLGPAYERLNDEFLDPSITRVFDICNSARMFEPAPKAFQGSKWKPEYISPMAQAQKMVGISGQDRVRNTVGIIAGFKPEIVDLWDADADLREAAEVVGINPSLLRAQEEVDAIRQQRSTDQAAAQQLAASQQVAQTAQTLSQTNTQEDNGLTQLLNINRGVPV